MLQVFGGMVIGSMMTMMLLGGVSAADQVLEHAQSLYINEINRPDSTTTLILLAILSLFLGALSLWPPKRPVKSEAIIKKLKRHCK
jgi:hypothetical protein